MLIDGTGLSAVTQCFSEKETVGGRKFYRRAEAFGDFSSDQQHRVWQIPYKAYCLISCLFHFSWVREFLNDENNGLRVLVEYLTLTQESGGLQ